MSDTTLSDNDFKNKMAGLPLNQKISIQTTWHGINSPRDYFRCFSLTMSRCDWVQCKFKSAMNAARLVPATTADELSLSLVVLLVDPLMVSVRSSFLAIQMLPLIVWQSSGATSGVETFWTISNEVDPSRSVTVFQSDSNLWLKMISDRYVTDHRYAMRQ